MYYATRPRYSTTVVVTGTTYYYSGGVYYATSGSGYVVVRAPRGAVVHRWESMLPQFRSGYLRALADFLARTERTPRLVFAGDYLVGPTTEAALTSGLRAATETALGLGVGRVG